MIIGSDLIALGLESSDALGAIKALGTLLLHAGYVKDTFIAGVIERELAFPTGIPLGSVNVALPHTDSIHVIHSSIAVGVMNNPVLFHVMGNPQDEVEVELIVMMAIKEPEDQVATLSKLAQMIQQPDLITGLVQAGGKEEIVDMLLVSLRNQEPSPL